MSYFSQIKQDVVADLNNSATDAASGDAYGTHSFNLLSTNTSPHSAYNFTGSSSSTLGVALIQVSLKTTCNATVYIDQSPDGSNWDIVDSFTYYYSKGGQSWDVRAENSYVRVRVTSVGSVESSSFRLQTALCPVGDPTSRSLGATGRLKSESVIYGEGFQKAAVVSPMRALKIAPSTRLIGAVFQPGASNGVDTNFWTSSPAAAGGATGRALVTNGELVMETNPTGTTDNNTVTVVSVRAARYVSANTNFYRSVMRLPAWTTASGKTTTAKWGAWDLANDGYYFEAVQTDGATTPTLQLRSIRATSVATAITSFNGDWGTTYAIDNNVHTYEIYWTNSAVWYLIDDVLLHKTSAPTDTLAATQSMKIGMSIANTGTHHENNKLISRVSSISRLGALGTLPQYFHGTTAATNILKYGPGTLHTITLNNPGGTLITVYDNTAGSGTPVIAVINAPATANPVTLHYNVPFYNGLSVVTTGTWDYTVAYE